jgi:hypothetical protein
LWIMVSAANLENKEISFGYFFRPIAARSKARLAAIRDFWLFRFGDCPPYIRKLK